MLYCLPVMYDVSAGFFAFGLTLAAFLASTINLCSSSRLSPFTTTSSSSSAHNIIQLFPHGLNVFGACRITDQAYLRCRPPSPLRCRTFQPSLKPNVSVSNSTPIQPKFDCSLTPPGDGQLAEVVEGAVDLNLAGWVSILLCTLSLAGPTFKFVVWVEPNLDRPAIPVAPAVTTRCCVKLNRNWQLAYLKKGLTDHWWNHLSHLSHAKSSPCEFAPHSHP